MLIFLSIMTSHTKYQISLTGRSEKYGPQDSLHLRHQPEDWGAHGHSHFFCSFHCPFRFDILLKLLIQLKTILYLEIHSYYAKKTQTRSSRTETGREIWRPLYKLEPAALFFLWSQDELHFGQMILWQCSEYCKCGKTSPASMSTELWVIDSFHVSISNLPLLPRGQVKPTRLKLPLSSYMFVSSGIEALIFKLM